MSTKKFLCPVIAVSSSVLLLIVGTSALASTESDSSDQTSDQTLRLEEVVVTAEKREENLEKVPISLAVVDRATMEQRNIYDLSGVANISPGVDFGGFQTTNSVSIRGLSTGTGYPTTAIYIDDTPVQVRVTDVYAGNVTPQVFDLERVEVLRGPQGTLYGAGSEGGILRLITPQPSLTKFDGYARAGLAETIHGDMSYETGLALGGPIIENELGFRVSAWHRRDGGYIDQNSLIAGGYHYPNANWQDSDVVRGAMTFAPTAAVKITPAIFYQHTYLNTSSAFDPATSAAVADQFTKNWAALNPQYTSSGRLIYHGPQQQPQSDRVILPSLRAELDLASVNILSNTSYLYRSLSGSQDWTATMPAFIGIPWPTTAAGFARSYDPSTQNSITEELRAHSTGPGPLHWIVGAFYNNARQAASQFVYSPYFPTQVQATYGAPIQTIFGQGLLPGGLSYVGIEPGTVDTQLAAFGQITYDLFSHLSVVAGARVAHDTTKYEVYQNGPLSGPTATTVSGEQSQHVVDPKAGINWQINDGSLLYFSASKGDRIGGINPPLALAGPGCEAALAALGVAGAVPPTYGADWAWSYELGTKNRLAGGRADINASAFYINWSSVQQQVYVPACAFGFTSNLGQAVSKGFDLQTDILITDKLKFGLSIGYTDARDSRTLQSGGLPIVAKGQQTNAFSSPWVVVPTLEQGFAIGNDYNAYIRLQDAFHSKNPGPYQPASPGQANYDARFLPNDSYNQLDMHVGATWNTWDVSLYALNILNNRPLLTNNTLFATRESDAAFTIRPLTVGVMASYHW